MGERCASLARRVAAGAPLVGTFVKTPSPIIAEVLSLTALDLVCLDAEHAPFGRLETDACIAQLRAADLPCLVRVADGNATEIRMALDSGATGVLVPHVTSAAQAENLVRLAHFGEGGRGYAGSTRAAGFTTRPMPEHLERSAAETCLVLQIEDLAALDAVDEIAQVDGVQALFIGRVDLAVAMGKPVDAPEVETAVRRICAAGQRHGRAVGMFTPRAADVGGWMAEGASLFLLGSDQGFILQGAAALVDAVRGGA